MTPAVPKPERVWDPAFIAWIREQPCILAGVPGHRCVGSSDPCHFPSRGAGGDDRSVYPGCRAAHDEEHRGAETFQAKYGINLPAICAAHRLRYLDGDHFKDLPF